MKLWVPQQTNILSSNWLLCFQITSYTTELQACTKMAIEPKRDDATGKGRRCTVKSFMICTHPQISLGRPSQGGLYGRCTWHAWERTENIQGFGRKARRKETSWKTEAYGIRMGTGETGWGSAEWIQLAQDRGQWRYIVTAMTNLRVLAPRS
jgi:hypothetical protein